MNEQYVQGFEYRCGQYGIAAEDLVKSGQSPLAYAAGLAEMLPGRLRKMFNMVPRNRAEWVLPRHEMNTGKRGYSARTKVMSPSRYRAEQARLASEGVDIIAPLNRLSGAGRRVAAPVAEKYNDKWEEYKKFKQFIPRTVLMSTILKKTRNPDIARMLDAKFGENKWIIKERQAFGTKAKNILTPENIGRMYAAPGGIQFNYARGGRKIRDIKNLLVQERSDIRAPGWQRGIDNWLGHQTDSGNWGPLDSLRQRMASVWPEAFHRGTKEYRVHIHGGQVIPHATINRGSVIGALGGELMPWAPANARKAEAFAAQVAQSMKGGMRKGIHGLDVGIDASGKPFMIELNPNTPKGGMSGILTDDPYMERVRAYFEGRTPSDIVGKRLAYGVAGTGAAGAGGLGAYEMMKEPEQERA